MGKEVERKFLLADDSWRNYITDSMRFIQAYISHRRDGIVRLRICNDKAFLTLKGITKGIERHEWEYEIPIHDAYEMLENRIYEGEYLEKTRYIVVFNGLKWEIDCFHGRHDGLVLAEIELPDANMEIPLPAFIGKEVSGDPRYFNSTLNLSGKP